MLVEQVSIFIGNNKELLDWFKSIVGYEPKDHPIEKPAHPLPKPDLVNCKTTHESPSYRCVPKNVSQFHPLYHSMLLILLFA
jgi:paired amphipathic helix protein Sin3a